LLLLAGLIFVGFRGVRRHAGAMGGGMGGLNGMIKAKARVIDAERPATRFADVAGYASVKTEISEVVDYLRDRAATTGPERAARAAC
jgi:cell division protease FtsH